MIKLSESANDKIIEELEEIESEINKSTANFIEGDKLGDDSQLSKIEEIEENKSLDSKEAVYENNEGLFEADVPILPNSAEDETNFNENNYLAAENKDKNIENTLAIEKNYIKTIENQENLKSVKIIEMKIENRESVNIFPALFKKLATEEESEIELIEEKDFKIETEAKNEIFLQDENEENDQKVEKTSKDEDQTNEKVLLTEILTNIDPESNNELGIISLVVPKPKKNKKKSGSKLITLSKSITKDQEDSKVTKKEAELQQTIEILKQRLQDKENLIQDLKNSKNRPKTIERSKAKNGKNKPRVPSLRLSSANIKNLSPRGSFSSVRPIENTKENLSSIFDEFLMPLDCDIYS